ncbi:hypothetical protein P7C71_g5116, partial [Lecanoromycetidae sp. Uapishka_2]
MQHFLFGSIVPAVEGMGKDALLQLALESEEQEGGELALQDNGVQHVHRDNVWGDCCGIKIPSTVAAAQEAQKGDRERLRTVPFD